MIINDLKKKYGLSKVYDAAIRNQIDLVPRLGNRDLKDAFVWFKSPEGEEFWNYINNGDFHNPYRLIPDLFDEKPLEVTVAQVHQAAKHLSSMLKNDNSFDYYDDMISDNVFYDAGIELNSDEVILESLVLVDADGEELKCPNWVKSVFENEINT